MTRHRRLQQRISRSTWRQLRRQKSRAYRRLYDTLPPSMTISPVGYFQQLLGLYRGTAGTNLNIDPDEPYDPAEDAPYNVIDWVVLK